MSWRRLGGACVLSLIWGSAAPAFVADDNEWPNGNINYQIRLGGSASGPLIDGANSWTTVALDAMAEWNRHINDVQFTGQEASVGGEGQTNLVNDLFFSSTIYGDAFGSQTLAVTLSLFQGFSQPLPRVESDIVFNNKSELNWNSYRGARRFDVDDLRRVLIHELGHALGLDHPDDAGQSVSAIMNALVSDIDTVVTDDILGGQSMYGVGVAGVPDGGGGTPSGDDFEDDDVPADATTITNGVSQTHSIHEIGDKDWVKFTVGGLGAEDVVIETTGVTGDTEIFLFGPDSSDTFIDSDDDTDRPNGNFFSRINRSSLGAGTYFVRIEEFSNNATIGSYDITVSWTEISPPSTSTAKLANLSVRAKTGGQFGTLILGFATSDASKDVLVRGIGPSLVDFGVTGAIGDPVARMFNSSQVEIASNDDWVDASNSNEIATRGATLGAFAPTSGLEAILLQNVSPAPYTVLVSDFQDRTGEVLIEAYDADSMFATGRLVNLSTRTEVGGAAGTLIAGFVISGTGEMTLLIRGVGPTLAAFGVSGVLSDPFIRVLNASQQEVGGNDDWNSSGAAAKRSATATVGAFALQEGSLDSALLITLAPGAYTVLVEGFGGAAGNALVEIYEVP